MNVMLTKQGGQDSIRARRSSVVALAASRSSVGIMAIFIGREYDKDITTRSDRIFAQPVAVRYNRSGSNLGTSVSGTRLLIGQSH